MIFVYRLILPLIALFCSPLIVIALIVQPKFRAGFFEKLGFYKKIKSDSQKQVVVFHAVSVGEVNAIAALVRAYRLKNKNDYIILTTTTKTGNEVAIRSLSDSVDKITYFPFDFDFSVKLFFKAFSPSKVIIAETEIWPAFAQIAYSKGIDVYTVNGRISPNSYNGYKKFKFFFSEIFKCYKKILMQSVEDKSRIIGVGAPSDIVEVMGNLKYDIHASLDDDIIEKYRQEFAVNNYKIFVAASTHQGEDEIVLDTFRTLKNKIEGLKLIIAPRHPQRYEQVEALIKQFDFSFGKRSNKDNFVEKDVIMLDTMGELSKLFSISTIAFVGGSFSDTGGHNPLEASIWGVPVLSGPCVFNFKDVYKLLVEEKAAIIADSSQNLYEHALEILSNEQKYQEMSDAATNVFEKNRGAVDFVLNELN